MNGNGRKAALNCKSWRASAARAQADERKTAPSHDRETDSALWHESAAGGLETAHQNEPGQIEPQGRTPGACSAAQAQ